MKYGVRLNRLSPHLRERFVNVESTNIESVERFRNDVQPHSLFASMCLDVASKFITYNGLSAAFGMRQLHLLDTESARRLISDESYNSELLDIGSGNGDVTVRLAPLFKKSVTAIEVSRGCRFALRKRPEIFRVLKDMNELDENKRFDVVSLFNVLDRCDCPKRMLSSVEPRVNKYLFVSAAFPWVPYSIESGDLLSKWKNTSSRGRDFNDQELADASSFEDFVERCEKHLFKKFKIKSFSRVPYLCQGTQEVHPEPYEIDCALFVLTKT